MTVFSWVFNSQAGLKHSKRPVTKIINNNKGGHSEATPASPPPKKKNLHWNKQNRDKKNMDSDEAPLHRFHIFPSILTFVVVVLHFPTINETTVNELGL